VGFFAARFTGAGVPASSLSPAGEVFSTVRSVEADSSGRVQIAFDETRRRVVSGATGDRDIQRLLLAAAREDNPAVRVESVDLLRSRAGSGEVRDALLNVVARDSNAGVRLKALDGLKPLAGDPQVRKTLAQVLLADDNPAVRMQVVDLLVLHRDDSMVGVLQNLVQKEDNNYVRLKCEKALKDMNASIGTF
jgi:HEAT repeat protein